MIAFVAARETDPRRRNLSMVREMLASRQNFTDATISMQQTPGFGGVLSRLGHLMSWYVDRELGSVMSTINRFTFFMDSPLIADCLAGSSFDPQELRDKADLYLILPQKALSTHSYVIRLWLTTILHRLTGGVPSERHPVLFMLDETGHLGHIQILEDATTIMTGYGIRLWFVFQSLGQMRESYGDKAAKLLDNIDTQQYFGINSFESAKALSEMAGEATILVESRQYGTSASHPTGSGKEQGGSWSASESTTWSEVGRPLLKPDEVRRLPEDVSLVFHRNLPVIICKLLRYDDHPAFRRGGTGSRGIGPGTLLAACILLVFSTIVAAFTAGLAPPRPTPRPPRPAFAAEEQSPPPYLPFPEAAPAAEPFSAQPPAWRPPSYTGRRRR